MFWLQSLWNVTLYKTLFQWSDWLFLVQGKYYNIILPGLLSEGVNRKLITYHGI